MNNKILITGSTGFIGSHLLEELLKSQNHEIILLKRSYSNTARIEEFINQKDKIHFIDVDKTALSEIFDIYEIEGIFHLAASYIKNPSFKDIKTMTKSNINFPSELLDLSVRNNVKYFINTGTYFEYSWDKLPLTEKSLIKPRDYYSTTKASFENILNYYSREFDLKTSTLRLFTPYGSRDDENKIIPYLILNTLRKNEVNINNPQNRLNTVHVDDIISAFIKVQKNIRNFSQHEIFNIANEYTYSIEEIYSTILNIINKTDKIIESKISHKHTETFKTKEILNWKTEISLKEGLDKTVSYYAKKYNL